MRRPAITGTGHANATDAVPVLRCDGIVARERTYAPRSILEEHVHEYAARPTGFRSPRLFTVSRTWLSPLTMFRPW